VSDGGFRGRRAGRLSPHEDGPVELTGVFWVDGDDAEPQVHEARHHTAARFRSAVAAGHPPPAPPNGSGPRDEAAAAPADEVDTSMNPHTWSRPIARLFRQPWTVAGMALAVGWIFVVHDYWVFLVTSGLVIGILALGLMVLVGWVREVSLASAAVFGTALYLGSYIYRERPHGFGWPLLVAMAASILIAALIMFVISFASVRFSGVYTMVFTLGVQITVERVVYTRYQLVGGGDVALTNPEATFFGFTFSRDDRVSYLFMLAWVAIVLALLQRLRYSPYGRDLMLVGADQPAAAAVGINPYKTKAIGFTICGALAGLAGILGAMLYKGAPSTFNYTATTSLLWLSIAILGGFDSMAAVIGVACVFQGAPL
jgi:branched-chain amino acid transport system permease protein